MLAQGPENRIEQLPISKALRYLMGSVYLPASFESDQTACIDLLLRLCSTVPVYRLECRPDIASAELTCFAQNDITGNRAKTVVFIMTITDASTVLSGMLPKKHTACFIFLDAFANLISQPD